MAKGYIIAHISVQDANGYAPYVGAAGAVLGDRYGARYLVRGGKSQLLEGQSKERHVVIEFDSYETAKAAYNDPEYIEIMKIRHANADSDLILVEGHE